MAKDIMDVKEVAMYLGFSPTKIYRMLNSGEIPNVKVGGQYRFPKAVIDDWLTGKLEVPGGKGEVARQKTRRVDFDESEIKESRDKKSAREKKAKAEDEIVGHLIAFGKTGDGAERRRAKQVMVMNLDTLDWQYLAARAQIAGSLKEAIAIEKEINKGG
jgi:excisionase family DNA binding protein